MACPRGDRRRCRSRSGISYVKIDWWSWRLSTVLLDISAKLIGIDESNPSPARGAEGCNLLIRQFARLARRTARRLDGRQYFTVLQKRD
jgi:hypothetical protein